MMMWTLSRIPKFGIQAPRFVDQKIRCGMTHIMASNKL